MTNIRILTAKKGTPINRHDMQYGCTYQVVSCDNRDFIGSIVCPVLDNKLFVINNNNPQNEYSYDLMLTTAGDDTLFQEIDCDITISIS